MGLLGGGLVVVVTGGSSSSSISWSTKKGLLAFRRIVMNSDSREFGIN